MMRRDVERAVIRYKPCLTSDRTPALTSRCIIGARLILRNRTERDSSREDTLDGLTVRRLTSYLRVISSSTIPLAGAARTTYKGRILAASGVSTCVGRPGSLSQDRALHLTDHS